MQRGVFSQAQTGENGGRQISDQSGAQCGLITSDRSHVDRRLTHIGLIQPVFWTVKTNRCQIKSQDAIATLEDGAGGFGGFEVVFGHADDLSALAGAEDAILGGHRMVEKNRRLKPRLHFVNGFQTRTTALAQVSPAPKATKTIMSPLSIRPARQASSRAMGMEAAEVLP